MAHRTEIRVADTLAHYSCRYWHGVYSCTHSQRNSSTTRQSHTSIILHATWPILIESEHQQHHSICMACACACACACTMGVSGSSINVPTHPISFIQKPISHLIRRERAVGEEDSVATYPWRRRSRPAHGLEIRGRALARASEGAGEGEERRGSTPYASRPLPAALLPGPCFGASRSPSCMRSSSAIVAWPLLPLVVGRA